MKSELKEKTLPSGRAAYPYLAKGNNNGLVYLIVAPGNAVKVCNGVAEVVDINTDEVTRLSSGSTVTFTQESE